MAFIIRETFMEMRELPITRNSAAPAEYTARNTVDASTITK